MEDSGGRISFRRRARAILSGSRGHDGLAGRFHRGKFRGGRAAEKEGCRGDNYEEVCGGRHGRSAASSKRNTGNALEFRRTQKKRTSRSREAFLRALQASLREWRPRKGPGCVAGGSEEVFSEGFGRCWGFTWEKGDDVRQFRQGQLAPE